MKKPSELKKVAWNRLFYNNKFAIFFSILLSIILWAVLITNDTQDHPHVITDVPIKVTLSSAAQQDGMKVFNQSPTTATVYVKGNSLAVNALKSGDLVAEASLPSDITTPGNYPLTLTVRSTNQKINFSQYSVSEITPSQVLVSVDRYREKTFDIPKDIPYKAGYQANEAYFVGTPTLSSDSITISGPEKQVTQVNRVALDYEISSTLTETKKLTAAVVLYDANGNKLEKGDLQISAEKVDVTIPVLPIQKLSLLATFTNKPAGFNFNQIQISPVDIDVAGPKDVLANMNGKFSLDPIDFSTISPSHNAFDVNINLPTTCKNLSNVPTARVSLDLGSVTTKQMTVSSFTVKNLGADKTAEVNTKNLSVTVVGPISEVSKLTDSNLVGNADMTGKENFTGQTEVPVTFSISNSSSCWVYGTYMATVNVTAKSQ
ncbi:MAG TPA: CdaR family protein [Caproicibacter sp.]|nr:CdaR family protein [Caproicibacter sp.]